MKKKTILLVAVLAIAAALLSVALVAKNRADDRKTKALVGQWTAAELTTVNSHGDEGLAVYLVSYAEDGAFSERCDYYVWVDPGTLVPDGSVTVFAADTYWSSPEPSFPEVISGEHYRFSGSTIKLKVTDDEKEDNPTHAEWRKASLDGGCLYLNGKCFYRGNLSVRELCERNGIPFK